MWIRGGGKTLIHKMWIICLFFLEPFPKYLTFPSLLAPINLLNLKVSMPGKKRRDKTAEEFGEALMIFLAKKVDRSAMHYDTFQQSLRELA